MKQLLKMAPIVILLLSVSLFAQETPFQAGIDFIVGAPQNEFKDNVDNVGFGLSGFFGYNIPQSPLTIGANIGFMVYGSETRNVPFSQTVNLVTVDMTTTNSIVQGHLMLRAQSPQGKVRPYIDGLLGFNYLFTSTSVEDEDDGKEIASSTNYDDGTFSYGAGGGIMIQLYEKPEEQAGQYFTVGLDLGLRYIKGGNARYLKDDSIEIDDVTNAVTYNPSESTTDLLNFRLGVVFNF